MDLWADTVHVISKHVGDRWCVVLIASIVHAFSFWAPCAFFLLVEHTGICDRWKFPRSRPDLRPTRQANLDLNRSAFQESITGTFVVVPVIVFLLYPLITASGMSIKGPVPVCSTILVQIACMIIGCDTIFYWFHRLMHHPLLYKRIHKQHHEFKASTVWASEYFSPADLVLNILPGVVPAILLKSHFCTLMIFTCIRGWQTVQSHAGFDLPFDLCNLGPFKDGAKRHDFHHSHNHGCYGDWFYFWDWVCGTDQAFREHYKNKAT